MPTPEAIAESVERHLEVYGQGVIDSLQHLKDAQVANRGWPDEAAEARARANLATWQAQLSAVQSILDSASEV